MRVKMLVRTFHVALQYFAQLYTGMRWCYSVEMELKMPVFPRRRQVKASSDIVKLSINQSIEIPPNVEIVE